MRSLTPKIELHLSTASGKRLSTACRDEAASGCQVGETPGCFRGDENDGSLVVTELSEDEVDGFEMIAEGIRSQTTRRKSPSVTFTLRSVLRASHSGRG